MNRRLRAWWCRLNGHQLVPHHDPIYGLHYRCWTCKSRPIRHTAKITTHASSTGRPST